MKHKFIIITLITALLLTGCNKSSDKESENTTPISEPQPIIQETEPAIVTKPVSSTEKPVITKPAETEEKKNPSAPEANDKSTPIHTNDKGSAILGSSDDYVKGVRIPENIIGPDLNKIGKADITDIKESAGTNGQRQWLAHCGGFVYLSLPSELCFDDAGDPMVGTAYLEFKRYNVGDEIMGFTVKEAESYFTNMNIQEENPEKTRLYRGGTVSLEGKVTMEGYITISADDDPMYMYENEIFFVPAPDNELLPILDIPNTVSAEGISEKWSVSLYPPIILGSAKYGDFDLSNVPKGEAVKATVTIDGVSMIATDNMRTDITAEKAEIVIR